MTTSQIPQDPTLNTQHKSGNSIIESNEDVSIIVEANNAKKTLQHNIISQTSPGNSKIEKNGDWETNDIFENKYDN